MAEQDTPAAAPRMSSSNRTIRLALAAVLAGGLVYVHAGPAIERRPPEATVAEVKPILLSKFVGEVDERVLEQAALRAMVGALGDPHSSYMTPEEAESFQQQTDRKFGGLGIEIEVRDDGAVRVIAPLEDTPAFRAGLLPGDVITEVDGVPCGFRSVDEAARRLKGDPDTEVVLTVFHYGATRAKEISIRRAIIKVPSVREPTIEDAANGIGYVRITSFARNTGGELRAALTRLREQGAKAYVIDLRRNPGGYLVAALDAANLFLSEGKILETRGRERVETHEADASSTFLQGEPVCVLINGASASAAEILAGALKDGGVATVVGTRSYGKGSVQQVMELDDGSALRLTIEHFYTRSGRRIHRMGPIDDAEGEWGIEPDIEVDLDARLLHRILRRRAADFQGAADGSVPDLPAVEDGADSEPLVDAQLDAAIEHLRKQLAK